MNYRDIRRRLSQDSQQDMPDIQFNVTYHLDNKPFIIIIIIIIFRPGRPFRGPLAAILDFASCPMFLMEEVLGSKTYLAKVVWSTQQPEVTPSS